MLKVLLSAWLLSSSLHAYDVITTNPCEGHANGARVANPQNCSKFFVCLDEFEAVSSSCPSGLHFNNELSECDFPSKAGCEIQIIGGGTCDCNNCCSICNCNNGGTTGVPTTTPGGCDTPGTGPTAAPTPSPTPTPSPEPSPTPTPSPEPSPTPTPSPEPSPTPTPSPGPSPTPTPSPGPSPTPTPSPGPSPSPTPTPSPGPSSNPTPSPGPSPSPTPTPSPGPSPSPTPTPTPSPGPSPNPTPSPEPSPTSTPSPGPSPTPTPSPEPSPSPTPTKLPYDPTTAPPPGIPNCHNNITVCINKPDNEIVYPVGTCREYYICLGGCAQVITCPNNLLYNKKTKQCDYPHNVDCPYKPIPPPVGPTAGPSGIACDGPGKCANKPDGTKFVSSSPNKYIECQCECELERSCPSDLFFNPILQVCDWTDPSGEFENFVCINNSPICESQKDGSVIPIEGVCNQFYKCYLGCAVQQICPDNLVYNQNKQYCDFPQNYKCPWTNNPPTGPHAGPSGIACVDGGRCANKSDGTFFNSTNSCGKYVICQCGCEVEMNCPQGLSWDTSKKTCNYSNLVQCNL